LSASGESSDERKKSEGKREDSKKRHSDQATTSQDKTKSTESGQKNGGNKTTGSQSTAEARDLSKSPPEGTVHRDNETKVERPEDIQTATGPTEGTSPRNTKPTKSEPPKKLPAAIPRPASAGFLMLSLDRSVRNLKEVPEDILDKFYLKKLTLYRNCLTALPSKMSTFTDLTHLDVSHNKIDNIPDEFSALKSLQELLLVDNKISKFPKESEKLEQLTKVDLSSNGLKALPADFCKLPNLQTLNLSRNSLTSLPNELMTMTSLIDLTVSHNQLRAIPSEISKLANLQSLDVNTNAIAELNDEVGKLTCLGYLDVSYNQLKTLPKVGKLGDDWSMPYLVQLYATRNNIEFLNEEWFNNDKLPALAELGLSHNKLTSLPTSLGTLTTLTYFEAKNNRLRSMPTEVGSLVYLVTLDVGCNELESVPTEVGTCNSLAFLNLFGNKLKSLPSEINQLSYLQWLWLSHNQLTSVDLQGFELLEDLFISGNPIKELPETIAQTCPNLKKVYASNMLLTTLPTTIGDLQNVEQLDLSHNELTTLPLQLRKMTALTSLYLSHNKLENSKEKLEDKVIEGDDGPWDCIAWWNELEAPQEIDLSHNNLRRVPYGVIDLRNREAEVLLDHNPLILGDDIKAVKDQRNSGKRFKVGWSDVIGQRPTMEDAFCIKGDLSVPGVTAAIDLFGIFDGHAGREAALFSAEHITDIVTRNIPQLIKEKDPKGISDVLTKIFKELNDELSNHLKSRKQLAAKHCGTTAVIVLIIDKKLYVANVGDSRAVLFRKDKAIRMTFDHKPRAEEERIKSIEGGCVIGDGGGRVNGQIAVSRSLGDFYMHPYVIYEPHTFVTGLTTDDKFIIIACDGVWDEVDDELACKIVSTQSDPFKASAKLRDYAYLLGSDDNISALLIKLQ
jgi:leucine-rich repeat protein SHOC2